MLRLESLRKELGLTQNEFAKKINMTQQRISAYEKGKREPDLQTLQQFADFFNVSTDYLLGRTDIRNLKEHHFEPDKLSLNISPKDYFPITRKQKEQIEDFAKYILRDNSKQNCKISKKN